MAKYSKNEIERIFIDARVDFDIPSQFDFSFASKVADLVGRDFGNCYIVTRHENGWAIKENYEGDLLVVIARRELSDLVCDFLIQSFID